jgi:SAM-dependent methyltransferase
VDFTLLATSEGFAPELEGTFDLVYCFDVLVHCDLHTTWRYFQAFYKLLKPGGLLFVSVGNLLSDPGFQRFSATRQDNDIPFFFLTEAMAVQLAESAGFQVARSRSEGPGGMVQATDNILMHEEEEEEEEEEGENGGLGVVGGNGVAEAAVAGDGSSIYHRRDVLLLLQKPRE